MHGLEPLRCDFGVHVSVDRANDCESLWINTEIRVRADARFGVAMAVAFFVACRVGLRAFRISDPGGTRLGDFRSRATEHVSQLVVIVNPGPIRMFVGIFDVFFEYNNSGSWRRLAVCEE